MKSSQFFPLSVLSLSLISGFTYAAEHTHEHAKELPTVKVKGDLNLAARRVTLAKQNETTDTQLKEVLKNEPSISIGGGNGTSQYIYVRGMGQNSIDVKVDNAYTDSQIHYHQGRHMLDPAMVKVLSVQKGAGSASAGIGQTNGAIIAKTLDADDLLKNSSNPNFGARINAGFNSNKGHNLGLSVFGKHDAFDFLLSSNYVKDDNYRGGNGHYDPINKTDRITYGKLGKASYLAKIGANFNNHRFVLSHLHEQHKGDRLVREEFGNFNTKLQAPALRKMSVNKTDLEWTAKDLGFAQSANANIYRLSHSRWSANDTANGYAGAARNVTPNTMGVVTWGANVNFDSAIHDKVLLKYGINYRNQTVKPHAFYQDTVGANTKLQNQQKQDVGVYAEAISDLTNQLTLTTGLRYDHFNFKAMDGKQRSDGALNPSVALTFQATPELSFRAHHNYATRSPRLHDAIMAHGARGVVSIGSNTKAEQARNTEIGFNYDNGQFGVEGSYFWQNIKDALGTTKARNTDVCLAPTVVNGQVTNKNECYSEIINAGKIKNHGYELSTYYRHKGLTARLGVAHSKPRFYGDLLNADKPEYASAVGRTWTAGLAYRFDNPNLEIGIQHRAVERVRAEDNFFAIKSDGTKNYGLAKNRYEKAAAKPGYGVTDLTVNWKPLNNDKMNVNFAVNNIGNKKYYPHGQRNALPMVGEGRQFRLGVNYTF